MKMRKLFAGLAAAATLLGGAALGATANATPTDMVPLTVHHAQEGHTYTAYRIATFGNPQEAAEDSTLAFVEINTDPDWVTALRNAFTANKDISLSSEYQSNPAAALARLSADHARKVVEKLSTPSGAQGFELNNLDGTSRTVTVPEGWYVVINTVNRTPKAGTTALVATKITDGDKTYTKFKLDKENGQRNIDALGEFNAKSENAPDTPAKTVENVTTKVNDNTVNVGDTVEYTIKHRIPAAAKGYDNYQYAIWDTASKGLTIDANSIAVKIGDVALTLDTDYQVTGPEEDSNTKATTTKITLTSTTAKKYAGNEVTVTYRAAVNSDILENTDQSATNAARAYTNGGTSEAGTTEVNTHNFQFKKVGVGDDENGLAGAKFVVKKKVEKDYKYLQLDTRKAWSLVSNPADATVFTSGDNGMVKLEGLSSGTYTVVETKAPTNYAQNFKATFNVTIAQDGAVSVEQDSLHLVIPDPDGDDTQVKNVKSVTQLPLTGAAGTVLFTVVALLVGGAGVAVAVKSRRRTY